MNLFNYIINNESNTLLNNLLNIMIDKKILNEELYLNLIKSLVLILDNNNFRLYYNILHYITYKLKVEQQKELFDTFKTLDLSKQYDVSDKLVEKVIISTHEYIEALQDFENIERLLLEWCNIIKLVQTLVIPTNLILSIYIQFIITTKNNQKVTSNDIKRINKFIK
jgi:hypothetical protein